MRAVDLAAQAAQEGKRLRAIPGGGRVQEPATKAEVAVSLLRPMLTQARVSPSTYTASVRRCQELAAGGAKPERAAQQALHQAHQWEKRSHS